MGRHIILRSDSQSMSEAEILAKYSKPGPGDCRSWTAGRNNQGYGTFRYKGRVMPVHVVAWILANGRDVPEGHEVHHKCRNKLCIEPKHLMLVTRSQHKRIQNPNAKLTDAQRRAIQADPRRQRVIAEEYGIARGYVSQIKLYWQAPRRPTRKG
jgi:hypothetical protein